MTAGAAGAVDLPAHQLDVAGGSASPFGAPFSGIALPTGSEAAPQSVTGKDASARQSVTSGPGGNGNLPNGLRSVSCTSWTSCVAVGDFDFWPTDKTLVESWDGVAWKVVPSPSPGRGNSLAGVSCTSSTNCVAVGDYSNGP